MAFAAAALLPSACRSSPSAASRVPPPPPTPHQSLGADQPPVIWIGGTIDDVTADALLVREDSGSEVSLERLARGATKFFRVSKGAWERLAPEVPIAAGQRACAETLMDGRTFLAIRVFLGAGCGPD